MKILSSLVSLLCACYTGCASHSPAAENTIQIEPVATGDKATALVIAENSIVFSDHNNNNALDANEGAKLSFKVHNTSDNDALRCKATVIIGGTTQIDATEMELNTIKAKGTSDAVINLKVHPDAHDASITITIMLEADGKANPAATLKMKLAAQETPARGRGK